MPALFPRRSNTIFRLVAGGIAAAIALFVASLLIGVRTPLALGEDRPIQQRFNGSPSQFAPA